MMIEYFVPAGIMFRQLQEAFGWEAFKAFFRRYHKWARKDPEGNYAKTDEQKRDLWAKTFSEVTGRNVALSLKPGAFLLVPR